MEENVDGKGRDKAGYLRLLSINEYRGGLSYTPTDALVNHSEFSDAPVLSSEESRFIILRGLRSTIQDLLLFQFASFKRERPANFLFIV